MDAGSDPAPIAPPIDRACPTCGYDLRALPPDAPCPRCAASVPCLSCGYNLHGLPPAGLCPECGKPIADSLRGHFLRYSSPEHLATLHRGVVLIQTGIIIQFLVYVGVFTFGVVVAAASAGGPPAVSVGSVIHVLITLVGTGAQVLSIVGWWMFSTPDPALAERDRGATARRIVRAAVLVSAAASIFQMAVSVRPAPRPGPAGLLDLLGGILGITALLAQIVWFFAAMRYLMQLAPRLPSERVLRRARLLRWLGPVLMLICGIGWLVGLILYYNLLDWVRKDLKAIRQAVEVPA